MTLFLIKEFTNDVLAAANACSEIKMIDKSLRRQVMFVIFFVLFVAIFVIAVSASVRGLRSRQGFYDHSI